MPMTSCPLASNCSHKWEPMKPAAPVTRQRDIFPLFLTVLVVQRSVRVKPLSPLCCREQVSSLQSPCSEAWEKHPGNLTAILSWIGLHRCRVPVVTNIPHQLV